MAELNGKIYKDWKEYIIDKFPAQEFDIIEENHSSSKTIIVSSKNSASETKIIFDLPTSELCRVCFYNPKTPVHNAWNDKEMKRALMYSDYELNEENLENTDDYINIPLYFGWTEKLTYYKGKQIKSELLYFDGILWQAILIEENLSWFNKAGCLLTLFAWPILYIQYRFVKHRLNSKSANVKIISTTILPMK